MSNNTNQFASSLGEVFMRIAGKIGSQRHLVAVRDSFIAMMPITLAGAIAVLLNVFLRDIPNSLGWTGFAEAATPLISINGHVYFGTIAIMALFFAFSLGYNMALSYKINPLPAGMVTFAAFVATIPQTLTIKTNVAGLETSALAILKEAGMSVLEGADGVSLASSTWGAVAVGYAGASGLFSALIIGMIASLIYCYLVNKKIAITLPDTVPPAVNKAFAAIIPGAVAIYVASIIAYLVLTLTGQPLNDLISRYIQQPLLGMSQSLGSVILMTFLIQLLWFFGLHGHNVLGPILDTVYLTALNENAAVYEATKDVAQLPHIWTRGSFDAFAQMGGSGVTIALIIAIFLFSKRDEHRAVAKLSAPMGIFNINEPITFGIPMVLNPYFAIPWLIVPPVTATIAYLATSAGLIPPVFAPIPWITPPGLYAFLATGGNVMAGLVSLFNVFVAFLIWAPFVIMANKVKVDE